MLRVHRVGIVVSLVLMGLVLLALVPLPEYELNLAIARWDLAIPVTGAEAISVLLAILVCAGMETLLRLDSTSQAANLFERMPFWALPTVITISGAFAVRDLNWVYQIGLILLISVVLAVVMMCQYYSSDPRNTYYRPARLTLDVVTWITALVLFIMLYSMRRRSLLSATTVLIVATALALEVYRVRAVLLPNGDIQTTSIQRVWLFAVLTGLMMGEIMWALNHYPTQDARVGGGFLLVVFYASTGLLQQQLLGRLSRRIVLEYLSVGILGLIILWRLVSLAV